MIVTKFLSEKRAFIGLKKFVRLERWEYKFDDRFLVELSLSEKELKRIPDLLDNFPHLEALYLDTNYITKIEYLEELFNLELLNLRGNDIKAMKGIETLQNLQILNVSNKAKEKND